VDHEILSDGIVEVLMEANRIDLRRFCASSWGLTRKRSWIGA
jgi:hypothetical protein